jgi:hypothetical protein
MAFQVDLDNKLIPPDRIAEIAIDDPALLQDLLDGVSPRSQKSTRRENCSQAMMFMAETWPETLLPHWNYFVKLFRSDNGSSKYVAIYVIASLTKADQVERFKEIFDDYFAMLDDVSVMVASHAALNAGKIGHACPSLQTAIVHRLLQIDHTRHNPGHLALVKAYIIEALDTLYASSTIKLEIMEFVKAQMGCQSPKTIKLAKAFLKKWD